MKPQTLVLVLLLAGCLQAPGPATPASISGAEALVWSSPFPSVVVEIDHVQGREPATIALEEFTDVLYERTDKERIRFTDPSVIRSIEDPDAWVVWHPQDYRALASDLRNAPNRDMDKEPPEMSLHVIYLHGEGRDANGQEIVGVEFQQTIILWPDAMERYVRAATKLNLPAPGVEYAERSVLVHELGHAMGLLNTGAPMLTPRCHPDDDRCIHSNNPDSVMYRGMSSAPAFAEMLNDGANFPHTFDEHDVADLEALRALEPGAR